MHQVLEQDCLDDPKVTPEVLPKWAVPMVNYQVRRRRYNDTSWLVRRNDWYETDRFTDAVWLLCEQSLTIEQIVESMAEAEEMSLGEALGATMLTLERFRALGLLNYGGQASRQ